MKVYGKDVLINALVDSGNLAQDLISLELASALKLPIQEEERHLGTAGIGGTIKVIGKAQAFLVYLEGLPRPVIIKPIVIDKLAHALNLGQTFLKRNCAVLQFDPNGGLLQIRNHKIPLLPPCADLLAPSKDSRFQNCVKRTQVAWAKSKQGYPAAAHAVHASMVTAPKPLQYPLEVDDNAYDTLEVSQGTFIPAGHTCWVPVLCSRGQTALSDAVAPPVFVVAKEDNQLLNQSLLLVQPGIYSLPQGRAAIRVSNLSDLDRVIPQFTKIAYTAPTVPIHRVSSVTHRDANSLTQAEITERIQFLKESLHLDDSKLLNERPDVKQKVIALMLKNFDSVSIADNDFGRTDLIRFRIDLKPGTRPHKARVRPLNPAQEADLKRQLDEWLEAKIIEPTSSEWGSALVPVRKKGTDKLRWAIDYRILNESTIKDSFPLSHIDTNLQRLGGAKVFSTLDSAGAFHNLMIDADCRDYTTFNSMFGQFRFVRLPFGVANGPAAYSRLIQLALSRLTPGYTLGYIDDIIVYSKSIDDHLDHLTKVIEMHAYCGMKVKPSKCKIFASEVEYLGHLVSADGIRMIPSYVDKVLSWPLPTNGTELSSFLGFAGYYRSFIPEFAALTADMNKNKKAKEIVWTSEMRSQFEQLKQRFNSAPVRGYPDYNNPNPFILDTDYSSTNMAAVLSQKQGDQEVFLGCVAKKCSPAQANYPSWKGELAAVHLGLQKFEHILLARRFLLRTDSSAVTYLKNLKETRGMVSRWQERISSFDFELQHRKGSKQINADALSRRPGIEPCDETDRLVQPDEDANILDVYAIKADLSLGPTDLVEATAKDPDLKILIPFLEKGSKPDSFQVKKLGYNGQLYCRVWECLSLDRGVIRYCSPIKGSSSKICLPNALFKSAYDIAHNSPCSGHLGKDKTLERLQSRFFAPGLTVFVHAMVQNCVPCVLKRSTRSSDKPTQHVKHQEITSYFNRKVYIDTVGPFHPASRYNGRSCVHFVSILDGFTRYLVTVPIPNLDTKVIAQAILDCWVFPFGIPFQIHTDQGTSFTSELFSELMSLLGVVKTTTPIYSPEGNKVERVHRLLGEVLRSYTDQNYGQWADRLKFATYAYNTSVHRITGLAPYEAVFGLPPRVPLDCVFPTPQPVSKTWTQFVADLKSRCQAAFERIMTHQGIDGLNLAPAPKPDSKFVVGDIVYYFLHRINPGISKKLRSRWIGPFKITRVISPSLVIISPQGDWATNSREIASIVSRLRKVTTPELPTGDPLDLQVAVPQDEDLNLMIDPFFKVIEPTPGPVPEEFPTLGKEDPGLALLEEEDFLESPPLPEPIVPVRMANQDVAPPPENAGEPPPVIPQVPPPVEPALGDPFPAASPGMSAHPSLVEPVPTAQGAVAKAKRPAPARSKKRAFTKPTRQQPPRVVKQPTARLESLTDPPATTPLQRKLGRLANIAAKIESKRQRDQESTS